MKSRWIALAAALLAVVGTTLIFAQAENQPPQKMHVGKIVDVAADHSEFTLQMGQAEQSKKVVLKVTPETTYELDGQPSTAEAALTVGAQARVRYSDDTATEVIVTSAKKGPQGEPQEQ